MGITKAVAWLLLVLSLLMFLGTGIFIFKQSGDADNASRYRVATECGLGADTGACYTVASASITSTSTSGGVLGVTVNVEGLGDESETLTAAGSQALFNALRVGSRVMVKIWQGEVTLVEAGSLQADTFANPLLEATRDQPDALIFVGGGLLMLFYAVILFRRARAPVTPVAPDFDIERSSGPFGLDGPHTVDVTRVYRLSHGTFAVAWSGGTVILVLVVAALRIQLSLLSGIIGAAIGLAFATYLAVALRRSSVEVGPRGITITGFRVAKTIPWADVESVGVQNGRCLVNVRNSPTSRNPLTGKRDFTAYLRVKENASMPGLIALYLNERAPTHPPSFGGLVAPPVDAGPALPSLGARLGLPVITTFASPFMAAVPLPPPLSAGQERLMHAAPASVAASPRGAST